MKKQKVLKYGIGVDMGMKEFHGCIKIEQLDGHIKVKASKKFKNTNAGHKQFYQWIEKNRKEKEVPYQVVVEVTGVYHEQLLYYLYDQGMNVCLEMPKRVKYYLESIGQYSKTDKLDSMGMAQMACERKLKSWKPCSPQSRELRTLFRHRKSLLKSKNQFSNQLHALEKSTVIGADVNKSLKGFIKKLDVQIERIEKVALSLAKEDKAFYKKVKMISDSVIGLGILSVLITVSETNGFEEFNSQKQLQSYAGFDIVENSSGAHIGKTKISKRGNVHLRSAMYMPSVSITGNKNSPYYNLYIRLVKRNGGLKKKAMVAVQRRLLVMIYTLWKKNEAFDPNYESNKLQLQVVKK